MRWSIEDVSRILGHSDVRTTQIYAHLAPKAVHETAARAHAAHLATCHGVVTAARPPIVSVRNDWHARQDSDLRHSASKAVGSAGKPGGSSRHDTAVTAICHVLQDVAEQRYSPSAPVVVGLEAALEMVTAAAPAGARKVRA